MSDVIDTLNFRDIDYEFIEDIAPLESPRSNTITISRSGSDYIPMTQGGYLRCSFSVGGSVKTEELFESERYIFLRLIITINSILHLYSDSKPSDYTTQYKSFSVTLQDITFLEPIEGKMSFKVTVNLSKYSGNFSASPSVTLTDTTSVDETKIIKPKLYAFYNNSVSIVPTIDFKLPSALSISSGSSDYNKTSEGSINQSLYLIYRK